MRSEACSVFNRALGQMQMEMEMEMEMEQMQMQMAASPPCLVREIAGKGVGMLAQRKLYPGRFDQNCNWTTLMFRRPDCCREASVDNASGSL